MSTPDGVRELIDLGRRIGAARHAGTVVYSADFDAYAEGRIGAAQVRCALCQHTPCDCPEFGTPEYFELINRRHGGTR